MGTGLGAKRMVKAGEEGEGRQLGARKERDESGSKVG